MPSKPAKEMRKQLLKNQPLHIMLDSDLHFDLVPTGK